MKAQIEIINMMWEGPLTCQEAYEKNNESSDYGVYQAYGDHPVYGLDVLLEIGTTSAIGRTPEQTFGKRLKGRDFIHWGQNIQICLGRICIEKGSAQPSDEKWSSMINQAGKLLGYACWPAATSKSITKLPTADRHEKLLILNWGKHRSLPPAISGYQQCHIEEYLDKFFQIMGQ